MWRLALEFEKGWTLDLQRETERKPAFVVAEQLPTAAVAQLSTAAVVAVAVDVVAVVVDQIVHRWTDYH